MTAKEGEEEVPPRVDFALKEKRVGRNTRERNFPLENRFLFILKVIFLSFYLRVEITH